jgi:thioredoxin-related protein
MKAIHLAAVLVVTSLAAIGAKAQTQPGTRPQAPASARTQSQPATASVQTKKESGGINWISLEEAEKLNKNKKTRRKIMVDVYTDWCGWCKRLDATSYKDQAVVDYINKNYYAVKLNAETRDTINFKGVKHGFSGRTNTVAAYFMPPSGGGYPTITYLDEDFKVVRIAPGYVSAEDLLKALRYVGDNYYLNTTFEKYAAQNNTN